MSDKELSESLLQLLGGKGNVTVQRGVRCMTRLRVGVRDVSKVDVAGIKALTGLWASLRTRPCRLCSAPAR